LSFDGTDDKVTFGTSDIFTPAAYTVEAWVSYTTLVQYRRVAEKAEANKGWELLISASPYRFYGVANATNTATGADWTAQPTVIAGRYYHVVLTVDATRIRLYVNGAPAGDNVGVTTLTTTNPLVIATNYSSEYSNITVGLFSFRSRVISVAEVRDSFNQTRHLFGV
jgi:hypothetical protein